MPAPPPPPDAFRDRLARALDGRYTVERELGGGGMSRTYVARETALDRRVVVKVLLPELAEGLSVERFQREILTAARLQHPHVVPVLAAGEFDGLPWFSMPFVEGESLRVRLRQGPLAIGDAVRVLRDVARALEYAHERGIVHRDIKPDNVLLSGSSATVTDFGIAKAISASRTAATPVPETVGDAVLTQAGIALGSPTYMAPEQAAADPTLDHRADLYALGAMAYELLVGVPPFAGRTPQAQLLAHLGEAAPDPRLARPDVPPALAELVLRCLAKAPADRPVDATAVAEVLDAVGIGRSDAGPTGSETAAAPSVGRALATWGIGVGGLAAVAVGAAYTVGLPAWTRTALVALAALGLPAVLFAAWAARAAGGATATTGGSSLPGTAPVPAPGTLATLASRAAPVVTWRRTLWAGALAVLGLATATGGFLASRALGIGPAASLIASGTFSDQERLVVAEFSAPADDDLLGSTIAEAMRTDLAQSPNLKVLGRTSIAQALGRMQQAPDARLTGDLAREVAIREGAKAVVDGAVVRLGSGYSLSARVLSADDGTELIAARETAENEAGLIDAVARLSRRLRERVGESLSGLQRSAPLARVTTASLPALRRYVEARRTSDQLDDASKALALLEEAVALDSTFAIAWRGIAVELNNMRREPARADSALRRAMALRDRLTPAERAALEAYYYQRGPEPDIDRAIIAYEAMIREGQEEMLARNNLSILYGELRRPGMAAALLSDSALRGRTRSARETGNYISALVYGRDSAAARRVIDSTLPAVRGTFADVYLRSQLFVLTEELREAARIADSMGQRGRTRADRRDGIYLSGIIARRTGQPSRALAAFETARRLEPPTGDSAEDRLRGIELVLDSSLVDARLYDRPERARARIGRVLASEAFRQLPPARQPWGYMLSLAADLRDAELGRAAYARLAEDTARYRSLMPGRFARLDSLGLAYATSDDTLALRLARSLATELGSASFIEAFSLAETFERLGEPDSAITWYRVAAGTVQSPFQQTALLPAAKRRLAELHDARGDVEEAIRWYEAFIREWADAEPALQPIVASARRRVTELRRQLDPG